VDASAVDKAIAGHHDESVATWIDLVAGTGGFERLNPARTPLISVVSAGAESWWGEDEDEEFERLPRGIVNPSDRRKIQWDVFVCACVVYLTMTMPYSVGFDAEASRKNEGTGARALVRYGLDLSVDFIFALDMVVSCFTAYQLPTGALVADPWKIRISYLQHSFSLDFASIYPYRIAELCNTHNPYIKMIRVVRVVRLSKLFKLSRLMKLKSQKNNPTEENLVFAQPGFFAATRMFLTLFVIAHMLACARVGVFATHADDANVLTDSYIDRSGMGLLF